MKDGCTPAGLTATTPFVRGLLDKWEIVPQAFAREEYKAVVQQFTEKQYSRANREATQALLRSYIDQIVDDVAVSRGLSTEQVNMFRVFTGCAHLRLLQCHSCPSCHHKLPLIPPT